MNYFYVLAEFVFTNRKLMKSNHDVLRHQVIECFTTSMCLLTYLPALQTRKELTQGKVKDKHWNWGSLLLGLGVVIGIAGPINTYIRVGAPP